MGSIYVRAGYGRPGQMAAADRWDRRHGVLVWSPLDRVEIDAAATGLETAYAAAELEAVRGPGPLLRSLRPAGLAS